VTFKLVRTDDLDLILELDRLIFPADYKLKGPQFLDAQWWLVQDGLDQNVGFGGVLVDGDHADLVRAGIAVTARGQGLQKRLIRTRVAFAKAAGVVEVRTYTSTANVKSQRSLISCGFRPVRYEFTGENGFLHFSREIPENFASS
jgi:ribosomal protein S18 acetylase RimI-like enzyme